LRNVRVDGGGRRLDVRDIRARRQRIPAFQRTMNNSLLTKSGETVRIVIVSEAEPDLLFSVWHGGNVHLLGTKNARVTRRRGLYVHVRQPTKRFSIITLFCAILWIDMKI